MLGVILPKTIYMNEFLIFFENNYEWLFSGILSSVIFWILGNKNGYKKAVNQSMKLGNNSKGIQVGGNAKINSSNND